MSSKPIQNTVTPQKSVQSCVRDISKERRASKDESQREKSIPKFNRKTQIKLLSRKKSETNIESSEPMRFISPKSNKKQFSNFFKSSKFEDVAHMFSSTIYPGSPRNSQMSSSGVFSQNFSTFGGSSARQSLIIEDRKKDLIEVERIKDELEETKLKNEKLKLKVAELNDIKKFLVERESYIFQLTEKYFNLKQQNDSLTSELNKTTLSLQDLKQKYQKREYSLLSQLEISKKRIDQITIEKQQKMNSFMSQIKQYKLKIDLLTQENCKLKEQIREATHEKSNEKTSLSRKKSKQNKGLLVRCSDRQLQKSKSAMLSTPLVIKTKEEDQIEKGLEIDDFLSQIEYESQKNIDNKTLVQLCSNITSLFHSSQPKKSQFAKSEVGRQLHSPLDYLAEREILQEIIKQLKQNNRYNEIQIDILKKMKLDTNKINQENEKLKANNRKLLNKIDLLTRKSSKRRKGSNDSLQLSLSPRKN